MSTATPAASGSAHRHALATGPRRARAARLPPLAPGYRAPEDHEVGVERQLAHLRGLAGTVRDHPDAALVELAAELPDRGLTGLRVVLRPLGQRRVPGVVHADQFAHGSDVTPPGRDFRRAG